jgi:superfamily I DNA/RNA helicase
MSNRSITQTLSGGNIVATLAFIDVEAYLLFRSHTHSGCDHPQCQGVADWLRQLASQGLQPQEIALFVRSAAQIDRAMTAAALAGINHRVLDEHVEIAPGVLSVSTMHLAKGLEFRAVGVMACDDEVIPLQERIEAVADESDLEDVYSTERHLLYVACTRARDHLLVTSTEPASEFLEDMQR